jgi:hypothetical protein
MSNFKTGDRVVCIRANGTHLKEGQDYIISGIVYSATTGSRFVELDGDTSLNFWESRFELIEQPSEVKYGLPLIKVKTVLDLLEDYEMEKEDIINYLNGYIDGAKGGNQ